MRNTLSLAVLCGALALVGTAHADSLTFNNVADGTANSLQGQIYFQNPGEMNTPTVYIDALSFTDTTTSAPLTTYCVDLVHDINAGQSYLANGTSTDAAAANIALAGRILYASNSSVHNATDSAALQIAIWSAVYGGGDMFNQHGFSATISANGTTAPVLAEAKTFYDYGVGQSSAFNEVTYYQASGNGGQDQISLASPVPEPVSMGLLASGVVGLVARRRRK